MLKTVVLLNILGFFFFQDYSINRNFKIQHLLDIVKKKKL